MSYCPLVQYFYKVLNGYKEPEIDNNARKTLGGGGGSTSYLRRSY